MADEEALSRDEKIAMRILNKEFDWYSEVREFMEKTFVWTKFGRGDCELFLDAMGEISKTRCFLCDLMTSVEIHHKDFSNHKSLINGQRAEFYNLLFESSHKASDLALKDYFASFQPSTNSLPFPDSDSKDGETSSQSENSNISSNTEPEMITRNRKRSPGGEEEEEESDGPGDIYHPLPPMIFEDIFEDGCLFPEEYVVYHDHSDGDLNYRLDDEDFDFDA